jgi:hypothetical protein
MRMEFHIINAKTSESLGMVSALGVGHEGEYLQGMSDYNGIITGDFHWYAPRSLVFARPGFTSKTFENVIIPSQIALEPTGGYIPPEQLPYVCSTCGAAFSSLSALTQHGYAAGHDVVPRPPPVKVSSGSFAGVGGYESMLPPVATEFLLDLRNRFIRPEVHRRLHPLI